MKSIDLLHGDCLELMKSIPDNSIDCCLTDPPYGTTACKWDNVIDLESMWLQLKRIVKDNGAICLFGTEPFSSHLRLSNLRMFKYDWVWNKKIPSGMSYCRHQPMRQNELVSVFYEKKANYVPQMIKRDKPIRHTGGNRKKPKGATTNNQNLKDKSYYSEWKYPVNIIKFDKIRRGSLHPTQKPVPLLEYLIKTYTIENETVLDFTMGSGSTGVACKNLNRKFIGIEKDETYFNIAKERINEIL